MYKVLPGGYIGNYIGFKVSGLGAKLLKGGFYRGLYGGERRGYQGGY